MDTNKLIQSLTLTDVLKTYTGKPGCACGCLGSYRVTKASRKEADKETGYPYADEDVIDRSCAQVLRKVQAAAASRGSAIADNAAFDSGVAQVSGDLQYIYVRVSDVRVYCVYLTVAAKLRLKAV